MEAWIVVALLVGVHFAASLLRFLDYVPRSRWLSFSGGVPVAFVFLELLPALARTQEDLDVQVVASRGVYVLALVGLGVVLAAEHAAKKDAPGVAAFWLSLATYGSLNALLGYLLVAEPRSLVALALFGLAVGLKFVVSDRALAEDHPREYARGRWIVVAAFLAGSAAGAMHLWTELAVGLVQAFLTGGIILAVMKEEVPSERQSSWWAFAAGAGVYTALVVLARAA